MSGISLKSPDGTVHTGLTLREAEERIFNDGWEPTNPNQRVVVTFPDRQGSDVGTIPIGQLRTAMNASRGTVRVLSRENRDMMDAIADPRRQEALRRRMDEEYNGTAAVNAAANALSFGAAGLVQDALAGEQTGVARARIADANENITGATLAATALVPTGGFGTVGALARGTNLTRALSSARSLRGLATAGPTAVSRALSPAARQAAQQLGSRLGMSARGSNVAGVVGREVTEGLVESVGGNLALASLNNTELSAEQIMADAGLISVLGLGLSGAGALGRGAVNRLTSSPGRALVNESRAAAMTTARQAEDFASFERRMVRGMDDLDSPETTGIMSRVSSMFSGVDAPLVSRISRRNVRDNFRAVESNLSSISDDMSRTFRGVDSELRAVSGAGRFAPERIAGLRRVLDDVPVARPQSASRTLLGDFSGALDAATDNPRIMRSLNKEVRQALDNVNGATSTSQVYSELAGVSRRLDTLLSRSRSLSDVNRRAITANREAIRTTLDNADVFGRAARIQNEQGQQVQKAIAARDRLASVFGESFTPASVRAGLRKFEFSSDADFTKTMRDLRNDLEIISRGEKNVFGASRAEMGNLIEALDRQLARRAEFRDYAAVRTALRQEASGQGIARQFEATGAAGLVGAALGGAAGGLSGMALGAAARALSNPMRTWQRIDDFAKVVGNFSQRLGAARKGLDKLFAAGKRLPGPRDVKRAVPFVVSAIENAEDRQAEFERFTSELAELSANPQMLIENLSQSIPLLEEFNPDLGVHIQNRGAIGLNYLMQHMPTQVRDPLNPSAPLVPPSRTEMDTFMERVRAVEDPMSFMEDLVAGRARQESADTVRAVYPELYSVMQQTVVESMMEAGGQVSYQTRIHISSMMGLPTDPTLSSDFIRTMQSPAAQTTEQARAIGLTGPQRRTNVSTFSQETLTQSQRLET